MGKQNRHYKKRKKKQNTKKKEKEKYNIKIKKTIRKIEGRLYYTR